MARTARQVPSILFAAVRLAASGDGQDVREGPEQPGQRRGSDDARGQAARMHPREHHEDQRQRETMIVN